MQALRAGINVCVSRGTDGKEGYESADDEHGVEHVVLEGKQRQAHVGENEVLCQEIQQLKQLVG